MSMYMPNLLALHVHWLVEVTLSNHRGETFYDSFFIYAPLLTGGTYANGLKNCVAAGSDGY